LLTLGAYRRHCWAVCQLAMESVHRPSALDQKQPSLSRRLRGELKIIAALLTKGV